MREHYAAKRKRYGLEYPDFYDNFVASFRFADATLGVIDGTCPAHYGYDARVEILCEKGVLFIGDIFGWGIIPLITNLRADSLALLKSTYARLIEFVRDKTVPLNGQEISVLEIVGYLQE